MYSSILNLIPAVGRAAAGRHSNVVLSVEPFDIWMIAIIIFVVFFAAAIVSALAINYRPGGRDVFTRRIWFWVLCGLTPIANFIYLRFVTISAAWEDVAANQKNLQKFTDALNELQSASIWSTIAVVVAFVVCGVILSKAFSKTKLGTWF